ncbi:OLC1v1028738C1 [Oldenlandia corymbosa var. corymbosa]|uniref:ABC-type xenobiotic transporter n=1 Tax=Oldenlandia corymbosa var. corymbosa TaxID=529605 RepID=A0AAV1CDI4_OLDCO|nr:OLC1v1028738C1 [Oldenlandia corymbosa var. corymbosa]
MEFFKEFAVKMMINVVFLFVLSICLLMGIIQKLRSNEGNGEELLLRGKKESSRKCCFSRKVITVILNFIVGFCYLGYWFYHLWKLKRLNWSSVFSLDPVLFTCFTWLMASSVSVHSSNGGKRWPLVLIIWWLFSAIFDTVLVSIYFLRKFNFLEEGKIPAFLSNCNVADFVAFISSLLLCFSTAFWPENSEKQQMDNEQPLLEEKQPQLDAYSGAGFWSKLSFMWLNPLFEIGHLRKLQFEDVPAIPQPDTAYEAFTSVEESLRRRQKNEQICLLNAIFHTIWRPLAINATFAGINTLASYVGPLLITSFVNFLSRNDVDDVMNWQQGLYLAFIMFFAKTVESLSQRQWYFGARRIGIRVKAALLALIYKKSLEIKYSGLSCGKVINLINVDVERTGEFFWHIHGIWLLPIQVTFALIILYRNLGFAPSFAALFTTILVMISNTPLAKRQEKLHANIMEARDSRIKAISEMLKSMKVLKLHSWEDAFLNRLIQLRETEKCWIRKYLYTCSAVAFLFWASPTLISVVTFGVCIALQTPLTSGTVLSALATFRILQDPIYNLPELFSVIAQTQVSVHRLEKFVVDDNQQKKQISSHPGVEDGLSEFAVEIKPGEYSWGTINDTNKPSIKISNEIRIKKGYKVAICGSVGSGKSSLLYSILGEIQKTSGFSGIKINGTKAFVPQSAWIQTGTIRDNVLFGKKMNQNQAGYYEDVLRGCALDRDVENWADGDLTIVGERGLNLSGGQKQRIQLARAIYSDSDILLLDDPFSAVDAETGNHIFKECLMKLLNGKTVIYVTHQLEFLDEADLVLVVKEGRVVQSGKYTELMTDPEGELIRLVAGHNKTLDQVTSCPVKGHTFSCENKKGHSHEGILREFTVPNDSRLTILKKAQQEQTETGRVKWHVYSTLITSAYGGSLVPVMLICHILFQGLQMASNYWLAWGTYEQGRVSNKQLICIFALLSAGSSFFVLGRALLLSTIAIETGHRLFLGMINSVFRAPLSFFDDTHSSRILSRSSTDQSTVDTDIPYRVAGLAFALIQLLSIIFLMSKVAWPVFFLFLIILAISIWYQAYYITTARELARMVGVQKAPILHHSSESVSGAATIRCFNQEFRFMEKNLELIDDYSHVAFYNSATMEWLCVRINFLFNLVFFLLLVILVNIPRSEFDPSLAGLAAAYGLNLNVLQAWVIWNLCNVENKMISVERILQFTNIKSEAPLVIQKGSPDPEWPNHGKIEIKDLHVQYRPNLPRVLKGITCTFPAEKKIGIVGRTGSGKSTLIQALFRVVEPLEGQILIDGIDISGIGLQDLRSKLSIIPQDPTLFQGTIRSNLDPLQQCSDPEIWEVLHKCHLADIVKRDKRSLDTPVAEDGENWSVGQRQLVCLARALLQKRRILVLDEATASVDTVTDNIIQKTIRAETNKCTVLSVAHRIPTVIDNDLVLVLGEGKVVEFDSPARLLEDKSSAFSNLVGEFLRRSSLSSSS